MSDVITAQFVELDLPATDKTTVTRLLAQRLADGGRVTDLDGFLADVAAREEQMPTGLEGGIGIPHARSAHVTEATLAFGRCAEGVDFGASDGPARHIFLIAAPDSGGSEHLKILASLARRLVHASFREALDQAPDAASAADLIRKEIAS
ncbi:MAG: PTS sugar transporter subunit IIA [Solirubrobacteraceae bacterium]|nr:PTS sugar transporter subunit IIA [Solirubrobacteraceae bacterium]